MSDDFSDETKSFRKTDTESNNQDDFESEISSEKRDATGAVESTSTTAPFASPFFGASLTPGLAGLPPFASPIFSPYYSTYNSANLMMAALAMSPQYQVAQNMLLSAMSSQMNSPTVSQPAYPNAAESSASCPSTPKSSMKAMKEPRELYKERIKKPLNSFMIYKKEMRPILIQDPEFANKHSADINAILGQRWHKLSEEEQQVYYEKARIEKEEHEKKYPGWSARDNYSFKSKRNPRKFQLNEDTNDQIDAKRCRALYGIENQAKWCRHCKVKKRCLLVGGSDGDDLPDVSTAPINNEQTVTPAPIMPQPVPMPVNPMMSPFRMPFSMYPFGFPPFPGISPNFGNTVQSFGQSKHETES